MKIRLLKDVKKNAILLSKSNFSRGMIRYSTAFLDEAIKSEKLPLSPLCDFFFHA